MSPERLLWQTVIFQAFKDATMSCDEYRADIIKPEADRWIRQCGRTFRMVCNMAGMDPYFLSDCYRNGRVDGQALRAIGKREYVTSRH